MSTGAGPGPVGPTLSIDGAGPITPGPVGPTLSVAGEQKERGSKEGRKKKCIKERRKGEKKRRKVKNVGQKRKEREVEEGKTER